MKALWQIKFYLLFSLFCSGMGLWSIQDRWGGQSSETVKNMDVKSIRQNPGSFRSHYLPFFHYTGGK